jgi:predicted ArsR family transcriptional regulator
MPESPTETSVHRALADERRARIVEELQANPDGLDAQELAKRLGLHANTIRWHLAVLADAGLVDSRPGERTTPGRPRIVFTTARGDSEGESYRLLATILTGSVAELPDASSRAEQTGRAWGQYLVDRPPPHVQTTDEIALQQIVALLDEHGFRPEPKGHEIRMHRCPFRELAETAPGVVCAVHSGLISGALTELRSRLEVQQLDAFVRPDLCIASLRVRADAEEREGRDPPLEP